MNLTDARHEAEQRKADLRLAVVKAAINLQVMTLDVDSLVWAVDNLIQARIKEAYKEQPWNT